MKKTLIIAICCIAVLFTACKKPVEPTPEPIPEPETDYSSVYIGNYLGEFTLTLSGTMDTIPLTELSFPFDSIVMDITKGEAINEILASMTIDNEVYQTKGTTTAEKADLETVHLNLNKPDFSIIGDIKLEAKPTEDNNLTLGGDFTGSGTIMFMGQSLPIQATGVVNGLLEKQ